MTHPPTRSPDADVHPQFIERWSPRAFAPDPIPVEDVRRLVEAARWAPSCFNDQPWTFVFALSGGDRERFAQALSPKNREWASHAPCLMFLVARKSFRRSGKPNRHAAFDTGAAWMSLALQARHLGLYAHAMAGFDADAAHAAAGVPAEGFVVMAAIAVGRLGDAASLPEDLRRAESPNTRVPLADIACEGRFRQPTR